MTVKSTTKLAPHENYPPYGTTKCKHRFVCNVDYCDFSVCTFPPGDEPSLHIEHVLPDLEFCYSCLGASSCFVRVCLLPELLEKWYTWKPLVPKGDPSPENSGVKEGRSTILYCFYQKPEDDSLD